MAQDIKVFISSVQREFAKERRQLCDYTSNASVQVMLFRDRVEIWNPGRLPDVHRAETARDSFV